MKSLGVLTQRGIGLSTLIVLAAGCSNNYKLSTSPGTAGNSSLSVGDTTGGGKTDSGTTPKPPSAGSGGSSGGTTTNTCSLQNVKVPVKIMFVVDTSGSNTSWTMSNGILTCTVAGYAGCAPPTDPDKTLRSGSITDFFNKYGDKSNFSWGFITFSGTSAHSYIGSDVRPAFSSAADMHLAINQFNNERDGDATPYLAALNDVGLAISNDPNLHDRGNSAALYYVIFLSDGYPSDAVNSDGSVNMDSLNQAIGSIRALAPGRVMFSTVYYGAKPFQNAIATLSGMASGGVFVNVDTTSTSTIDIQDLIQVPVGQCQ